jgi:hypothetical protein
MGEDELYQLSKNIIKIWPLIIASGIEPKTEKR